MEGRLPPGWRLHGDNADEFHLRHPRHPAGRCYLSGSPVVFKGHPFSAITSLTLTKMLIAAGADPRAVHAIQGFAATSRRSQRTNVSRSSA